MKLKLDKKFFLVDKNQNFEVLMIELFGSNNSNSRQTTLIFVNNEKHDTSNGGSW